MINRSEWVKRHNIKLDTCDYASANYVGNGHIAFGFDITGLQNFNEYYEANKNALVTMSSWGWHRIEGYTMDDFEMTVYDHPEKGAVSYAVEQKEGNEEVYHWLRETPHRFNLAKIGLLLDGKPIEISDIEEASQELDLYHGIAVSKFVLQGYACKVTTVCDQEQDVLGFKIESELVENKRLGVSFKFPYGSPDITGSKWDAGKCHSTQVINKNDRALRFDRVMDETNYTVELSCSTTISLVSEEQHTYQIIAGEKQLSFAVGFSEGKLIESYTFDQIQDRNVKVWESFWQKVGAVDFSSVEDERGMELERRVVLSLYQSRIHGSGEMPPQETGLGCNSWYGKFHLEMHPLHSLYMPMWSIGDALLKSIQWYENHLEEAIDNAARNSYKGAKWPKMVADDAIDSPSPIATLLIWQQPHILYMLACLYECEPNEKMLYDYEELIIETVTYMCDLVVYNEADECYDLIGPVIPVQEVHKPMVTENPAFEVAYWAFGLNLAIDWLGKLPQTEKRKQVIRECKVIADRMAPLPIHEGLYIAHKNCPDTFEKFNRDHPSMVMAYGFILDNRVEKPLMEQTYNEILKNWTFERLWGWDFAMLAMTAVRLGDIEGAIDILLFDTPKNSYVKNGHNFQRLRDDLPIYLPGNGSLLLAVGMLAAGIKDAPENLFDREKNWRGTVVENIKPLPY